MPLVSLPFTLFLFSGRPLMADQEEEESFYFHPFFYALFKHSVICAWPRAVRVGPFIYLFCFTSAWIIDLYYVLFIYCCQGENSQKLFNTIFNYIFIFKVCHALQLFKSDSRRGIESTAK